MAHTLHPIQAQRAKVGQLPVNPITVSALSTHIVALFERDELLRDVAVIGEVSNWKRAASGHIYFSVKDSGANMSAVMWRGSALSHSWLPRDGDQIVAHGYVGIYPERGVYQLYVNRVQPAGRGQLYVQFEALKAKLEADGLFALERKRPIPPTPQRIGIVTSRDAAALRDILRVLTARWPLVDIVVFSCLVQGSEAPGQIVAQLECANRYSQEIEPLDTLILARGGGSIEDLWSFNDERVAYAIAASALPVVVGVGHETDFTIADFVADLRAPTPSAAAAACVPDHAESRARLASIFGWMSNEISDQLDAANRQLGEARGRLLRVHPQRQIDQRRQRMDDRERRLHSAQRRRLDRLTDRAGGARAKLDALNPIRVLARGYSIVQRNSRQVITGPSGLQAGETLEVRAAQGSYQVAVTRAGADGNAS